MTNHEAKSSRRPRPSVRVERRKSLRVRSGIEAGAVSGLGSVKSQLIAREPGGFR